MDVLLPPDGPGHGARRLRQVRRVRALRLHEALQDARLHSRVRLGPLETKNSSRNIHKIQMFYQRVCKKIDSFLTDTECTS